MIVVYIPSPIVLFGCRWHFDAQVGEDGSGYVTDATLSDGPVVESPGCTREPCDAGDATGRMIPWPARIEENGPVEESLEVEFCLRPTTSGEGGPPSGSPCEIHLPIVQDAASHNHEIGDGGEFLCEVSPLPPAVVGLRDVHFTVEDPSGQEDIEIVH
jgi:hypothetical protein